MPIVMLRGVGQCVVTATGVEHPGPILLLLLLLGMLVALEAVAKALLGRDPPPGPSNVPPTTQEPRVVPPRGPPGAGVGTPPREYRFCCVTWRAAWSAQASSDSSHV